MDAAGIGIGMSIFARGLLCAFAACFALQQIPFVHQHMTLVVLTGVVFTALYGGLCILFGLTEDEKFILRKLGGKLAKKFVGKPRPA